MSETKAGNIEAIRDWSKRYFYTKSDVSEFFTKLNTGLTAYKLTIIGPANTEITITDNDQTNPQEYVVKTDSTGKYIGLFFFNEGNALSLTSGTYSASHQLDDYVDFITMVPLVIATPVMTSDTTPSGHVTCSSNFNTYPGWHAFKQLGAHDRGWVSAGGDVVGAWIKYEFPEPVNILKLTVYNRNESGQGSIGGNNRIIHHFKFQGSSDDSNWHDFGTIELENIGGKDKAFDMYENTLVYKYYRLLVVDSYDASYVGFADIQMYKADN